MTTAAEYRALAERAEREGASRELRDAVLLALGWEKRHEFGYDPVYQKYYDTDFWYEPNQQWPSGTTTPPEIVSSLDAVAALMRDRLPGWRVAVHQGTDNCWSMCWRSSPPHNSQQGDAPTEPLSRLAAALRAMAVETENG